MDRAVARAVAQNEALVEAGFESESTTQNQYWTAPTILDPSRSYSARKPPEKEKACGIPIFLIQPAVKSLPNIQEIRPTS
jgi:hypothetical protein